MRGLVVRPGQGAEGGLLLVTAHGEELSVRLEPVLPFGPGRAGLYSVAARPTGLPDGRPASRRQLLPYDGILSELTRALLDYTGGCEAELLQRIVGNIAVGLNDWCAFSLIEGEGWFKPVALHHPVAHLEALGRLILERCAPVKWQDAALADSLRAGEIVVIDDFDYEETFGPQEPELAAEIRAAEVGSVLFAPMRHGDTPIGLLVIGRTSPVAPWAPPDLEFAREVAARAALAVRNARLVRELALERDRLRVSRDEARAARATLETIVLNAPVGIAFVDRELRCLLSNRRVAAGDALQKPLLDSIGPTVAEVFDSGLPSGRTDVPVKVDGSCRYMDITLYPVRSSSDGVSGVALMAVDNTRKVLAGRTLQMAVDAEQQRSAELLAVFDTSPSAILVYDRDGRVRYASRRVSELFGFEPEWFIGRHYEDLIRAMGPRLLDPGAIERRAAELQDDEFISAVDEFEYAPSSEGIRRVLRRTTAPVRTREGRHLGRLFVYSDVTRERDLEKHRRELLAVISHELKTPLTPLAMVIQLLGKSAPAGCPADPTLLRSAGRQLSRLTSLVDDLLDFSRLESGRLEYRFERLELSGVVQELVEDFGSGHLSHEVVWAGAPEAIVVNGDRLRLEQVLVNLLENAVKYSPRGTRVEVSVERRDGEALLSVRDQGIGVPAGEQARLFELFFRGTNATTRHYGGLGVGLYLSRAIIERHEGRFEVESRPGEGSVFRLRLPLAPEGS